MRAVIAFVVGLVAGVGASVYQLGHGEGFGDVTFTYWSFWWRGRRVQFEISDRVEIAG